MNRHELLDALAALNDEELQATIAEARTIDPSLRELIRSTLTNR
ncbi:hypothetical protein ACFYVD_10485 [Rhodococcus pyridinivorans]